MADLLDQVHAEHQASGTGDLLDQVHAESSGGGEPHKAGFFESLIGQLNPMPGLRDWWNRPAEIGKMGEALKVLHGAVLPEDKGKPPGQQRMRPLTSDEQAIVDSGLSAHAGTAEPDMVHPVVAPAVHAAGQAAHGDLSGAAGTVVGAYGVPAAIHATAPIIGDALQGTAKKLYQSALKPGKADAATLGDVRTQMETGLNNGIRVTEAGANKLQDKISELGTQVQDVVDAGAKKGLTVSPNAVASRMDQLEPTIEAQVNPVRDLKAVEASKQEFLGKHTLTTPASILVDEQGNPLRPGKTEEVPIPVDKAQAEKQGTYRQVDLKSKYGEMGSASAEAQKTLARGLKEELEAKLPELKGLNAQESKLIDLQGTIERAVRRAANHEVMGLGATTAATGGAITGGPVGAAAVGFLKRVTELPGLKSTLALALYKGAAKTGTPITFASAFAMAGKQLDSLASQPQESEEDRAARAAAAGGQK